MKNDSTVLDHPLNELSIRELSLTLDGLNPPPMYRAQGSGETIYMPAFFTIDIAYLGKRFTPQGQPHEFVYLLSQPIDENWQWFFKAKYPHDDVTFDGSKLILRSIMTDPSDFKDEICNYAIHAATLDYWNERKALFNQVFSRMMEMQRQDSVKAEAAAVIGDYRQKSTELMATATERGIPTVVLDLNVRYQEILQVKFRWWRHVLDVAALTELRAMCDAGLRLA